MLHVIPGVTPGYGGPSKAILGMCRSLQQRGIDVVILTTDADGPGRLHVELGKVLDYQGVRVIFFPRQWSETFKYSGPLAQWLAGHVREFDLVHIHAVFSHACIAAAKSCRRSRVPYVVRPLGSLDPWSLRQKRLRKRLLWHAAVGQMLHSAAAIHYTTEEEKRLAEGALGLSRGVVVPLGVEDALFELTSDAKSLGEDLPLPERPYVLFLSRIHPKKGLELLLDAFLEAGRENHLSDWRLVVAGSGNQGYVESLQSRVHRCNGEGRVLFTGWLQGSARTRSLRHAALLALTSHQENFALSVVEALAAGVPVLVSEPVNLADEIRTVGAGWVVPMDRDATRKALAEAMEQESERLRRGQAGHDYASRHFRWPKIAQRLGALYASLVPRAG